MLEMPPKSQEFPKRPKNKIKTKLYKYLISLADDVMVNSIMFKKSFEKKFSVKVKCIYNPFDKNFVNDKIKKNYKQYY